MVAIDTPSTPPATRLVRRRPPLLPDSVTAYLVGIFGPLLVWISVLKCIRIASDQRATGVLAFLDELRSEVAMVAALFAAAVLLVLIVRSSVARIWPRSRRRWARRRVATWIVLIGAQTVALAVGVFETLNHLFIAATGSNLGIGRLRQYAEDPGQLNAVIATQLSVAVPILVVGGSLLYLGVPSLAVWVARRRFGPRGPTAVRLWPEGPRSRWSRAGLTAMVAVLSGACATFPAVSSPAYLSRAGTVNLAYGMANEVRYSGVESRQGVRPIAPISTYLEPVSKSAPKRNVVMVFMESVRADTRSTVYPYASNTPFIDSLAPKSIVATDAYVVVPHTSKALTAAHCGIQPPLDTANSESDVKGLPSRCLPQLLGEVGYNSVFYQSATEAFERRAELVGNFGFDRFVPEEDMNRDGFSTVNYFGYEDDVMLAPTRDWLLAHREEPFLASYLTVTTHHDYRPPKNYPIQHLSDDPQMNAYLNGVRYTDDFVRKLVDVYRESGLLDNTIFVVMADHGEGFGEHGLRQHDNTIYNEGVRIPFMIYDPARPEIARRISTPVQTISLLPTLTSLLGYTIEGGSYEAPSLLAPDLSGRLRISCFLPEECLALVDGNHKYIYHFGNRPDEYFDLAADPLEQHNIIATQSKASISALRTELLTWHAQNEALYEQRRLPGPLPAPNPAESSRSVTHGG